MSAYIGFYGFRGLRVERLKVVCVYIYMYMGLYYIGL